MIHKLILNTANHSSKNTNASVNFLVNFGFLDPHKHYKCVFSFRSQLGQVDETTALIKFSGGPFANNFTTSSTSANSYIYSSVLGTVHFSNYVVVGGVTMGSLEATTNDNTPVVFKSAPQQSEVTVELVDQGGALFTCIGGVPDWILSLSFEEYLIQ